jgi:hypothetical protein
MATTRKLKKNSVPTTLSGDITAAATTIGVTELSRFYDKDGVLITRGIVIGGDNANSILPEEITITGASATSGAGDLTGVTRGVNADGTIGAGYAWTSGSNINVTFSTGIYEGLLSLPNRNAIINGDCRVNQRLTAYTLVKDAYTWDSSDLYGPDRHEGMATGTLVSAGTFGQSVASLAGSSGYGFHFSGVTLTGTGIIYQRGRIEAKDAARFKNGIASFSCKIYHDIGSAKNFTVYIRKANSADNFAAVTAIGNSGAVSIPNAADTALKYENISMGDCSTGIEYEIKAEVGAITTKNVYISEIQIEPGPVATAFEYRPYQQELLLCTRYILSLPPQSAYTNFGAGVNINTTAFVFRVGAGMRASPTISIVGNVTTLNGTLSGVNSIVEFDAVGYHVEFGGSGYTALSGNLLFANNDATAKLVFASEL